MSEKNNCFKEAVCVEVQRVFDSCSDRDCIYELPVTLSEDSPAITEDMNIVRSRCVEIEATCISVNSVPFKSGYYSVDITYKFKIAVEAFSKGFCQPQSGVQLCGTAMWNKRVILYGSEGSAKIFTSEQEFSPSPEECCDCCFCDSESARMPKATVRVVDPIALDAKIVCMPYTPSCGCASAETMRHKKTLVVSLGLFSIIQLSRPVSIIVPAYDYCIPCKECSCSTDPEAPCDVFERIEFPTEQFFPQPSDDDAAKCISCGDEPEEETK